MPNDTTSGILQANSLMRHFSRILFLLGVSLSSVALSHAQALTPTLTVTDDLVTGDPADHGTLNHWEQFSTTLSASVSNPPQPEAETTLVGPTYEWSGGSTVVPLTSTQGQTNGLLSALGTELKPYGSNSINVTCTATYSENDSSGHFVKNLTPVSGSITVNFWSIVPAFVKQIRSYPGFIPGASGSGTFIGPPYWGESTFFDLQVQDNQKPRQAYGWGAIQEGFVPPIKGEEGGPTAKPNGSGGGSTWVVGGPPGSNNPYGNFVVGGNFTDHNYYATPTDYRLPPKNWTANTVVYDFDQSWTCLEQKPPYPSAYDQPTTLPSHHLTQYYLLPYVRTGG